MFSPITRRRFVNGAVQGGILASLADFSFLDSSSVSCCPACPSWGRLRRLRCRAARPAHRGTAPSRPPRKSDDRDPQGHQLPAVAVGGVPGRVRGIQSPGRLQIPRGPGHHRLTWPASPLPTRTAGCRCCGRSTISRCPAPPTKPRAIGTWAVGAGAPVAAHRDRCAAAFPGSDGQLERRRRRPGRSSACAAAKARRRRGSS